MGGILMQSRVTRGGGQNRAAVSSRSNGIHLVIDAACSLLYVVMTGYLGAGGRRGVKFEKIPGLFLNQIGPGRRCYVFQRHDLFFWEMAMLWCAM